MNLATAVNGDRSAAASRSLWRMAAAPLALALAMTLSGKAAADPPPYDFTYEGASGGTDINGVGIAGDPAPQTPVAGGPTSAPIDLSVLYAGGNGGNGALTFDATPPHSGGAGGSADANGLLAGATTSTLTLWQAAIGGNGGNSGNTPLDNAGRTDSEGAGGEASSILMLDDASASAITITTTAQAGNPGSGGYVATQPGADATANTNIKGVGAVTGASVATGGAGFSATIPSNGTAGGYAQAQTVVKAIGDNPAMATATATGGEGGAAAGEGASSVTGGVGGGASANAFARSGSGAVTVTANQTGGAGGEGSGGGTGGAGASSVMMNEADGRTKGSLIINQTAQGGAGGDSGYLVQNGGNPETFVAGAGGAAEFRADAERRLTEL